MQTAAHSRRGSLLMGATLPLCVLLLSLGTATLYIAEPEGRDGSPSRPQNIMTVDGDGDVAATIIPVTDYLAMLLVNEVPFPGEPSYTSAEDSKAAMEAIVWVIERRRREMPKGYTRRQVAATDSTDVIDIMTAANQMDGFMMTPDGCHTAAPRVTERLAYLRKLSARGTMPVITELLDYADTTAQAYIQTRTLPRPEPFTKLKRIDKTDVTGSAYGWMTDDAIYHPGGNFVRIPDKDGGSLGGNRFFTLRRTPLKK